MKTQGIEFNEIKGEAVTDDVRRWCVAAGLQQSFTASLRGHGEGTAIVLCEAWCAKMQFLFDSFCMANDAEQSDFDHAVAFEEAPQVQELYAAGNAATKKQGPA